MSNHPDYSAEAKRINRMIGQLEGVKRMIEANTYCPKILIQTKAVSSALGSLETIILEKHMHHCVKNSITKNSNDLDDKINELASIFKTRLK